MNNRKEDWFKFRNNIIWIYALYTQIKDYEKLSDNTITNCKNFINISRNNTLCSFYIKAGLIMSNGKPYIGNFLSSEDFDNLKSLYDHNIKDIRDKVYAHNVPNTNISVNDSIIDKFIESLINYSKKIDDTYDNNIIYEYLHGNDTIMSIESLVEDSNELYLIKKQIRDKNYSASIKLDIQSGKITIY